MNFVFSDKFLNSSFKWHKNSGRLCFWNVTFSMLWDVKSTVISCFAEFKLGDFLLMLNTLSTSLELLENSVQMVLSKLQHAPEYFSLFSWKWMLFSFKTFLQEESNLYLPFPHTSTYKSFLFLKEHTTSKTVNVFPCNCRFISFIFLNMSTK